MVRKPQVRATLPDAVLAEVDKHAKALGSSRGEYLGSIAKWWFAKGSPATSEFEEKVRERTGQKRGS
jgi:hypothetical protein